MSTHIGGAHFYVCCYRARFAGGLIKVKIASQLVRSITGTIRTTSIAPAIIVKLFVKVSSGRNDTLAELKYFDADVI
jgi:hypothetical protein